MDTEPKQAWDLSPTEGARRARAYNASAQSCEASMDAALLLTESATGWWEADWFKLWERLARREC